MQKLLGLILLSVVILQLTSCSSDKPIEKPKPKIIESISSKDLIAEDKIMYSIIDEYKKQYSDLKLEEINDEGWHELSFFGEVDSTTGMEPIMSVVRIPNYTLVDEEENNPLKGDLNDDGIDDYLVKVVDEGAGGGGNLAIVTYYIFASQDGKYKLVDGIPSGKLSGCDDDYGYFVPEKIENQQVIGESLCYAENDGRCCPSLKSKSIAAIQNGEFKLISKEETQSDVQASVE